MKIRLLYAAARPDSPYFMKGDYIAQEEPHATFAAMVTRLDVYVGQLVDKLQELGLYENTILLFSSDNGPHRRMRRPDRPVLARFLQDFA